MISTAVSPDQRATTVGLETIYENLQQNIRFLPQRLGIIGQGADAASYDLEKKQIFSAFEAGTIYGFGSPLHLAARQLLPANNDGVGAIPVTIFPLAAGTTAAAGSISVSDDVQTEQQTYIVKINEIRSEIITLPVDTDQTEAISLIIAGINAILEMPVIATAAAAAVTLTAKWKGESGNDLKIELIGIEAGITFAITQPTGGAANPDVQPALDMVGLTWETMFLNCLNISDETALEKYRLFGEGRWQPIKPKPCLFFSGNTLTSVNSAVAISDSRPLDRINVQLVAPGSNELPFVIAARQLARIVKIANSNPPVDYIGQTADGIVAGVDEDQWTDTERDFAVKKGSSTIEVVDNQIQISDVVTFYHPTGDPIPAYSYVVDIIKIMNVTYNIRLIFENTNWLGHPLIRNQDATNNPAARRPSAAAGALASLFEQLGLAAILVDIDFAKKSIIAGINTQNPRRLDISATYKISGNVGIISITQKWGFNFGESVAA